MLVENLKLAASPGDGDHDDVVRQLKQRARRPLGMPSSEAAPRCVCACVRAAGGEGFRPKEHVR